MLQFPDRELPRDHPDRADLAAMANRLDVPAGRIALSGSMSEYIADGLALRPVLTDAPRQQALTESLLLPVLPALEALLLRLRAAVDPGLKALRPTLNGAPYPLGRCLETTQAVQARLESLQPADLCEADAAALATLRTFQAAGGEVRRAWGDLRGQYFQNALIVGTLYVDVSNDTVVATKPPVQILPLAEADFSPIADYLHFARIAGRYWKWRFLPNHILPDLAPYAPLVQIAPNGSLRLGPLDPYMLGLTLDGGFAASEQALRGPPPPAGVFDSLATAMQGAPVPVAATPDQGRAAALARCRTWRAEGRAGCATTFNRAVLAAREVNNRLAGMLAVPRAA